MFANNNQNTSKIDVLFLTQAEEFELAPDVFVISQSHSYLGGIFSSTKLKFEEKPAAITDADLQFVSQYFLLLAYQEIALAENLPAPPNPNLGSSAPANPRFAVKEPFDTCTGPHESCCEAPGDDPNNCPASARTSDCDKKKSCCCG